MNASSLVLPPSGNADTGTAAVTNTASVNASAKTADGPTFAGALQDAAPKPAAKPARKPAAKAATGRDLPTSGNSSPLAAAAAAPRAAPLMALGSPTTLTGPVGATATRVVSANQPGISQSNAITPGPVAKGSGLPGASWSATAELATADKAITPAPADAPIATPVTPGQTGKAEAKSPDAAAAAAAAALAAAQSAPATGDDDGDATAAVESTGTAGAAGPPGDVVASAAALKTPVRAAATSAAANVSSPALRANSAGGVAGTDDSGAATSTAPAVSDIQAAAAATAAAAAATSATDAAVTFAAGATVAQFANQTPADQDAAPPPSAAAAAAAAAANAGTIGAIATSSASARAASGAALVSARIEISSGLNATDDDKHVHDAPNAAGSGTFDPSEALSQLSSNTTPSAPEVQAPTFQLQPNVDSGEFAQGLTDRVSWMVDNGLNSAKLSVNPPQLGPIELRIAVSGSHAQVWMSTHSAVTRDALESTSPSLKEMLGAQGFGQVSVDISQRSFQERSAYSQPYQQTAAATGASAAKAVVGVTGSSVSSLGALDAYA